MGIYIFQHPNTQEVIEVFQKMDDEHIFEKDGIKWNRLFQSPNTKISLNPYSESDWLNYTKTTNGTMGDLWDKSAELSLQRAKKTGGIDPVKEKAKKSYEKKTQKPHPLA